MDGLRLGVHRLVQGNEACAEGAIAAGAKFCAGYPITPSTEIIEVLSQLLPINGGSFIQMEDEIASMGAIIGASLAGAKVITATSGPGFSLKQENIGFAVMAETPCVIVNVMRAGPSTGLPTQTAQGDVMQSKWGTHGDIPAIVLCPSYVREAYEMTVRAFNLAEKYMTPVILLMDEVIGHMRERVLLRHPDEFGGVSSRKKYSGDSADYRPYFDDGSHVPCLVPFGDGVHYHVTGLFHDELGFPTTDPEIVNRMMARIHSKINENIEDILAWQEVELVDAEIALVAYGSTARSALAALAVLRKDGMKVGLFRPETLWPFPEDRMREIAKKVRKIIVPEQNLGQLAYEIERIVSGESRVISLSQVNGEMISPDIIVSKVREALKDE
jgi:2-oxoglutarate ferredoxin oxidoreductase subunit alpha